MELSGTQQALDLTFSLDAFVAGETNLFVRVWQCGVMRFTSFAKVYVLIVLFTDLVTRKCAINGRAGCRWRR